MTDKLTTDSAKAYVVKALAELSCLDVHSVVPNSDGHDALDVMFRHVDHLGQHEAVMTVWIERDGKLYGEW